eukprot:gene4895-6854_t
MKFSSVITIFLFVFVTIINVPVVDGFFGNNKKKEEEAKKKEVQDTIYQGMQSLKNVATDPSSLQETLELMNDPETMAEVKRLMNDPTFVSEMDRIKKDPMFLNAMQSAKEMYEDPEKAAKILSEIRAEKEKPVMTDAQLGLSELAKSARDPKMLKEAMDMLKDPEVAAEVQAMMSDPAFKAEMKKMTDSPAYKAAMTRAAEDIEMLSKDPAKLKLLKAQAEAVLKS